ncbi:MAG: cupin domain-containing protein [Desulfobacterales bacterium]
MQIARWNTSPRNESDGVSSYLLVSGITTGSRHLTALLIEMQAGSLQRRASREYEQCCFILEGEGMMTVGDESGRIGPGDCIFIPAGVPSGLVNDGNGVLVFFSTSAPSSSEGFLEDWQPPGVEGG